jgi:ATP/maltotriose-dependent transcriptional regulator MalT
MERRATQRFPMNLPVRVSWATKSGNEQAYTESENISSRGVYFCLPTDIENGSWVELLLDMPHEITLDEPVRFRCQARVRRTETKKWNRVGVAAEIEVYQLAQPSAKVVDGKINNGPRRDKPQLSDREKEIVKLVAQGYRNKEIGEKLFITESMVKNHLHNLYDKLGFSDRLELALYASGPGGPRGFNHL